MQVIKRTVAQLIKSHSTNNPFEIANQRNIQVLYEQLGDMMGYYNTSRRIIMIHINSDTVEQEQRFTCAHELGHVILHPNVNTPFLRKHTFNSIDRIEREANQFAVELLMPDCHIHENQHNIHTFQAAASEYGVPEELVHLKKI